MNAAMKIDKIKAYSDTHQLGIFDERTVLWGLINPKFWSYGFFPELAALDIQNFLLLFSSEGITLIGLTVTGDFTDSFVKLSPEKIKSFSFKKGLVQSKLGFTGDADKYLFKIPNFVALATWQKRNLQYLIANSFMQK